MTTNKWVTNKFFRSFGFSLLRNYWHKQVENTITKSLDKRSSDACKHALHKSRTLDDLVQNLVALGQEFEMSASMASATGKYETYESFLLAAIRCYHFAFTYTNDSKQMEKMERAQQELKHRMEITKKIHKW